MPMSSHNRQNPTETKIPLTMALSLLGGVLVLGVLVIWIIFPAYMPGPLYRLTAPYLSAETMVLPTPLAVARLPEVTADTNRGATLRLPGAPPTVAATQYPDYFVSAAAAAQRPQTGEPLRIVIPAIEVDAPISEIGLERLEDDGEVYYQWAVPPRYEAGWHNTSARLGQIGNTVLNGHHNIYGEVFRDLVDLEEGDEIILYDVSESYTYQVTEVEILPERGQPLEVRLENARWIETTTDERITLITCWPYTGNAYRLVVVAKPEG